MNPVFSAASNSVELGWLLALLTVLFLAAFVGWALWAFAPTNQRRLEAAARIPFDDENEP